MRKNSGITLIALVITIIVLLILAGVSISMTIGNNGILGQAVSGTEAFRSASDLEQIRLAAAGDIISAYDPTNTDRLGSIMGKLDPEKLHSASSNGNFAIIDYGDAKYKVNLKTGETEEYNPEYVVWDGTSVSTGLIGEGTTENPYLISSGADLKYFANQCCGYQNITGLNPDRTPNGCDLVANDSVYKVTTNISLDYKPWTPVGVYYESGPWWDRNYFRGVFDADNHEITKFRSYESEIRSDPSRNGIQPGLFCALSKATIKNLFLTDVDVKGESDIGVIAGSFSTYHAEPVTFANIYISGNVGPEQEYAGSSNALMGHICGGIAAWPTGNILVDNCTTNLNIKGDVDVGGLFGKTSVFTGEKIIIKNSTVNGTIDGGHESVGGLIGICGGNVDIINCVSNASISNTDYTGVSTDRFDLTSQFYGGLIGYVDGRSVKIINSHSTGDILIRRNHNELGGIVGFAYDTVIENCYNTGNITCTKDASVVGGLVGEFYVGEGKGVCKNSYNKGNITLDLSKTINKLGILIGVLHSADANYVFEGCHNDGTTPAENNYGLVRNP